MPDYPANAPWNYDEWLNRLIKDHQGPNHPKTTDVVHIGRVESSDWNDTTKRQGVLDKLPEEVGMPGSGAGLGQTYYNTRNNFTADAFKCWKVEHNRTMNCEDYKSDKKRLLPNTGADRKELGLDPKGRPNTFLCEFCPYHSVVMQRQRKDKFKYDYTS
jgi:hypothetical protein